MTMDAARPRRRGGIVRGARGIGPFRVVSPGHVPRRCWTAAIVVALVLGALAPPAAGAPSADAVGKIDSHLVDLIAADARGVPLEQYASDRGMVVKPGNRVLVDVYFVGSIDTAEGQARAVGMGVQATNDRAPFKILEGWLPLPAIGHLASNPNIETITAVLSGGVDVGAVTSEGDAAHNGPAARALGGGVTGAGVRVGVISDSINLVGTGIAGSQATGDLPATVNVVDEGAAGSSDEGRAMAEIIYDMAPGITTMDFASGTDGGATTKANNIAALVTAGADVIADDIFYITEPFFQDGQVSQAVDTAVANGTAYFASAGNRARQSYEATYADNGGLHDFDPGAGTDTRQTIANVPNNAFFQLSLQWAEPWGNATTDLNAILRNAANGNLLVQDTTNNVGGNPIATVTWTNNTGGAVNVALDIARANGAGSPFMKYIARGNFGTFTVGEFATNSDTINPDAAAAAGSLAIAAVDQADAGHDDPQVYSSRGLLTRRFDASGNPLTQVRQKPNIAGADNVNTTVPGFQPFGGTSAATPSVAGIAALMLSSNTTLTVPQLYAALTNPANTIDCNLPGNPDSDCGFGFVLADLAVGAVRDTSPPVITPTITGTIGDNGWYVSDVTVSWSVTDGQSAIASQSGCGTTTITADTTGTTLTCTATSVGGTSSQSVTITRDATAPTLNPTVSPNPVYLNGAATASPNASDATSGLASASCPPVDTSMVGAYTLVCTAEDNAGNTASASATYFVIYKFAGFFMPVDNPPLENVATAGRAVPMKWRITDANDVPVLTLTSAKVTAHGVACDLDDTADQLEEYATGESGLLNLGNGYYQFNWDTPKSYKRSCKEARLNLGEGSTTSPIYHTADFRFVR